MITWNYNSHGSISLMLFISIISAMSVEYIYDWSEQYQWYICSNIQRIHHTKCWMKKITNKNKYTLDSYHQPIFSKDWSNHCHYHHSNLCYVWHNICLFCLLICYYVMFWWLYTFFKSKKSVNLNSCHATCSHEIMIDMDLYKPTLASNI